MNARDKSPVHSSPNHSGTHPHNNAPHKSPMDLSNVNVEDLMTPLGRTVKEVEQMLSNIPRPNGPAVLPTWPAVANFILTKVPHPDLSRRLDWHSIANLGLTKQRFRLSQVRRSQCLIFITTYLQSIQ